MTSLVRDEVGGNDRTRVLMLSSYQLPNGVSLEKNRYYELDSTTANFLRQNKLAMSEKRHVYENKIIKIKYEE
jgi:hypothetical protein